MKVRFCSFAPASKVNKLKNALKRSFQKAKFQMERCTGGWGITTDCNLKVITWLSSGTKYKVELRHFYENLVCNFGTSSLIWQYIHWSDFVFPFTSELLTAIVQSLWGGPLKCFYCFLLQFICPISRYVSSTAWTRGHSCTLHTCVVRHISRPSSQSLQESTGHQKLHRPAVRHYRNNMHQFLLPWIRHIGNVVLLFHYTSCKK